MYHSESQLHTCRQLENLSEGKCKVCFRYPVATQWQQLAWLPAVVQPGCIRAQHLMSGGAFWCRTSTVQILQMGSPGPLVVNAAMQCLLSTLAQSLIKRWHEVWENSIITQTWLVAWLHYWLSALQFLIRLSLQAIPQNLCLPYVGVVIVDTLPRIYFILTLSGFIAHSFVHHLMISSEVVTYMSRKVVVISHLHRERKHNLAILSNLSFRLGIMSQEKCSLQYMPHLELRMRIQPGTVKTKTYLGIHGRTANLLLAS